MIDDISAYIFFRTTYEFLHSQFDALAFGWLGNAVRWVHGIASSLLALHLMRQGYQLMTRGAPISAVARMTETVQAAVILALACGATLGGATLFDWLSGGFVRTIAALVHGSDGDLMGERGRLG